jgi:site-specific DNA-methyltransferase (adenine-specific)
LRKLPDECIDVIFADPPYFMQTDKKVLQRADGTGAFKGCDDHWDKYDGYADYDEFSILWLTECRRVLKPNGTIWVIGSFQNIYRLGYFMQNLGFWILNDVVWSKTNPTPNMSGSRFCNAHETLLWCAKSPKSKFTFNYKTMKHLNNGKQDKSVWTLGICQGNERIKDAEGKKLHTTQKPETLLEKIVLASTAPNDIILDPFFGTGTTGAVAKKYGRQFIGIEREEKYIKFAQLRIDAQEDASNDITNLLLETKPPRVSLEELIKASEIAIDEPLYDNNGQELCRVLQNGKVSFSGEELSIHKASAQILHKDNHNGWSYFYVKRDGKLVKIDELRYRHANAKYPENT